MKVQIPNAPTPGKTRAKAGQQDLIAQALTYPWTSILDVGAGDGWTSRIFRDADRKPFATFLTDGADADGVTDLGAWPMDAMDSVAAGSMDAIWAAHVLEHAHNTGLALQHVHRVLADGGWLFLSVPPYKARVVGGHVNVGWNLGLLAYVLAIHGFDAKGGAFVRHGYNLAAFVRKGEGPTVELCYDRDDLERLGDALPPEVRHGADGDFDQINWSWKVRPVYREPLMSRARRRLAKLIAP